MTQVQHKSYASTLGPKCPACRSDSIRRSHTRRSDGLRRTLFCSAYRCRNCHQRFFRLNNSIWFAAGGVVLIALAVAGGWALRDIRFAPPGDGAASASIPTNSPAPAAPDPEPVIGAGPPVIEATAVMAEQGDAKAQFELGMALRDRQSSPRDLALAYAWLEKSARQGYADAQYVLGAMHVAGKGTLQSFPLAVEWFERAAQQNHAEAQFNMGRMYRRGHGVELNNVKAYMWFNLAAAQGHDRAREARDNLLPLLTPEQIKAAQRESQDWRPTRSDPSK